MKILIAPDSFKGSATSKEIAVWLSEGIHSVIPDCEIEEIAIGDGGEGSIDAILHSGFNSLKCEVSGPLGNLVSAQIAMKDKVAFIELAQASGLSQLPSQALAALDASTYGTGELIRCALDQGAEQIILAVGGSASTDSGAGALQALGVRLQDKNGIEIAPGGRGLARCTSLDISEMDPRVRNVQFILASDVENPLLGRDGAAHVFSPQKGATSGEVDFLEKALSNFACLCGGDYANKPGAGAAGGFGFMAYRFLNADQRSGIELILEMVDFEKKLYDADFVITGEGKYDSQTLQGKAPSGILKAASQHQIPVLLVCGMAVEEVNTSNPFNFHSIYSLESLEPNLKKCRENPGPLLRKIGEAIALVIKK